MEITVLPLSFLLRIDPPSLIWVRTSPTNRRHYLVRLRQSLTSLRKADENATTTCPLTVLETSRGPPGPAVPLISMSVSLLISNIFSRSRSFSNRPSKNASQSLRKKMVISAPP